MFNQYDRPLRYLTCHSRSNLHSIGDRKLFPLINRIQKPIQCNELNNKLLATSIDIFLSTYGILSIKLINFPLVHIRLFRHCFIIVPKTHLIPSIQSSDTENWNAYNGFQKLFFSRKMLMAFPLKNISTSEHMNAIYLVRIHWEVYLLNELILINTCSDTFCSIENAVLFRSAL